MKSMESIKNKIILFFIGGVGFMELNGIVCCLLFPFQRMEAGVIDYMFWLHQTPIQLQWNPSINPLNKRQTILFNNKEWNKLSFIG